jgi:PKD repeat protein
MDSRTYDHRNRRRPANDRRFRRGGRGRLSGQGLEALETRTVLSAPPAFVALPAQIDIAEGTGGYFSAGYARVDMPAADADSPQSSLTYQVVGATPPPAPTSALPLFVGNTMTMWFPAGDGPYQQQVTVRVTDETGLYDQRVVTFNVTNRAPSVDVDPHIGSFVTPVVGEPARFAASAIDPVFGGQEALQASWDFGDGVVTAPQPLTTMEMAGSGPGTYLYFPVYASHAYTQPGNYTVKLTVSDDDGGVTTWTLPQTVTVGGFGVDGAGVLRVGGTAGNDQIHVSPGANGQTNLFLGGALRGVFAANAVVAYGNAGEDVLDAAPDLSVPVTFYGGPGNDLLRGGAANDSLLGEAGNDGLDSRAGRDVLVGGDGNDIAFAGAGNDLLVGGRGSDSLYGETGDDILISGYTDLDGDPAALGQALSGWNLPYGYDDRTTIVRALYLTPNVNVHDSDPSDVDWLWGGTYGAPDRDYLMGSPTRTKFADRAPNERVESLI